MYFLDNIFYMLTNKQVYEMYMHQYTEADLYKQLTYFCYVLDTVRCIDKVFVSVFFTDYYKHIFVLFMVDLHDRMEWIIKTVLLGDSGRGEHQTTSWERAFKDTASGRFGSINGTKDPGPMCLWLGAA